MLAPMVNGDADPLSGYEYHAFLSYRRVKRWRKAIDIIHDHLEGHLQTMLGGEIAHVRVFKDTRDIDVGSDWPGELGHALARSVVFVPVLWPEYFAPHRHWCRKELSHMLARREQLRQASDRPPALIFPLKIVDFVLPVLQDVQAFDVSDLPVSPLMTPRSAKSRQLEQRLHPFADQMLATIRRPPPFDPGWVDLVTEDFSHVFTLQTATQHDQPGLGDAA